ncbi:phage tail sheath family protein [Chryseobacterium arthrosphaerae]|uniref:phage tail sheath family protein n=1 Tax=Chryseobacterium arthrosphaerae TaxID=651561 RepID=UPI001E4A2FE9|nr:phage tail sheath C-terminal domain-containing protein [Chryseobacterium arthrosphaerae]UEQ78238.1 phage tail sheath family protein [Chryseobacterium arthrosphaerae]
MSNPTTPGVSVEEIATLPHSVALIETAVPVFIGYTELVPAGNNKPLKINSLLDYELLFGKAKKENIQLKDVEGKGTTLVAPQAKFLMYYSLQMYFANGGGPCYIFSVGPYPSAGEVSLSSLQQGLGIVEAIIEPALIILPDAVSLTSESDFYEIYNEVISKLGIESKNRFALLDTYYGNSETLSDGFNTIDNFGEKINLTSHAAAYFPHLKTVLNYTFDENAAIVHTGLQASGQDSAVFYAKEIAALDELKRLASEEISIRSANAYVLADLLSQAVAIAEEIHETADPGTGKDTLTAAIVEAEVVLDAIYEGIIDDFINPDDLNEDEPVFSGEFEALKTAILGVKDERGAASGISLKNLESSNSALYNHIKQEIQSLRMVLPPSSAMAGVYGRVDSTRGVWKAPANVSLNYVMAPTEKISDQEQAGMHTHISGKSINAIRTFTGKGTLVWGARTVDGQDQKDEKDNTWKYIQVRRYYDMLRQSVNDALAKFIKRPNTEHTWLRAKNTIENFLHQQWMDGALAGNKPKEAYEVIINGIKDTHTMETTIRIALVRPAEFIVLKFSHKLQKA